MDLFGALPKTSSSDQHVLVFIDQFTKLALAISVTKVTSIFEASVLVDH